MEELIRKWGQGMYRNEFLGQLLLQGAMNYSQLYASGKCWWWCKVIEAMVQSNRGYETERPGPDTHTLLLLWNSPLWSHSLSVGKINQERIWDVIWIKTLQRDTIPRKNFFSYQFSCKISPCKSFCPHCHLPFGFLWEGIRTYGQIPRSLGVLT